MLKACCEALVYFGELPGQQAWGHFGALFKLGGLILKRTTAVWDGWPMLLTGGSH